jgi:hypothetical protein
MFSRMRGVSLRHDILLCEEIENRIRKRREEEYVFESILSVPLVKALLQEARKSEYREPQRHALWNLSQPAKKQRREKKKRNGCLWTTKGY